MPGLQVSKRSISGAIDDPRFGFSEIEFRHPPTIPNIGRGYVAVAPGITPGKSGDGGMLKFVFGALALLGSAMPAAAEVLPFPAAFRTEDIKVDADTTLHVRVGGQGPAVVLIHGFGDTGDMWVPLAADLVKDHTVVVPDLRGMGLSSHPAGGYDKKTQAGDIRAVLEKLGLDRAVIIGHDIGTMVAYAYAARYPQATVKLVVMDAPVPGIPPWDEIVRNPLLWHFDFGGPDAERLVTGRERIYLDRFWNEFAGNPAKIDEATRAHYAALYAQPGAMRSSFAQFRSIRRDAEDNTAAMKVKLTMPVLAIGGAKSFGAMEAVVMRNAAGNVTELVVPDAGHWLMEEKPEATVKAVRAFIEQP
jgi:pimeloyl-ACP methyl ester carboxylesterase